MKVRVPKAGKRWLILGHRWLGIVTGLFFALWIGSGLVMLYVPFPKLTEAERLARLGPIAWDRVSVPPDVALAEAGLSGVVTAFALEMRRTEPVYRVVAPDGSRRTVSARTGERLGPADGSEALALAGGRGRVTHVFRDQWTVTTRYDRQRPFLKVALGDALGTELYVSQPTGEIALITTRFERGWNWLGAVVHWIYPTPLRARPDLWRDVVLWVSGIAALVAISGFVLGIWRLRLRRPYPRGTITPYRGVARWHHLFGLAGGLTLMTFIVSGWLSMNPNRWFTSSSAPAEMLAAYAGSPGPIGLDPAGLRRLAANDSVAMRFSRIGGNWLVTSSSPAGHRTSGIGSAPASDEAAILAAARALIPQSAPPSIERLTEYDNYWYPHHETRPLPVLRLRFQDPAGTWLHIDPRDGAILNRLDRSGRVHRWLFSALHSFDLPVLTFNRPAWDGVQWLLNLFAGVIAITGIVMGWRRLVRSRSVRP